MRTRLCKKCGKAFDVPTGSKKYLCESCAIQSRKDSVLRERTCKICGTSFMGYPRSFFCPSCQLEQAKQRQKEYRKRKTSRPLGSFDICENCGKQYVVKSGLQKYCPECSKTIVSKNIRQHKIEYMSDYREKHADLLKEHRGKRYICQVCGKEFEKHDARVTCSDECDRELRRRRQNQADINRGKRKLAADQRYENSLPKSGITGITWHRTLQKWQAAYKGKYIGVFSTLGQAVQAQQEFMDKISKT